MFHCDKRIAYIAVSCENDKPELHEHRENALVMKSGIFHSSILGRDVCRGPFLSRNPSLPRLFTMRETPNMGNFQRKKKAKNTNKLVLCRYWFSIHKDDYQSHGNKPPSASHQVHPVPQARCSRSWPSRLISTEIVESDIHELVGQFDGTIGILIKAHVCGIWIAYMTYMYEFKTADAHKIHHIPIFKYNFHHEFYINFEIRMNY